MGIFSIFCDSENGGLTPLGLSFAASGVSFPLLTGNTALFRSAVTRSNSATKQSLGYCFFNTLPSASISNVGRTLVRVGGFTLFNGVLDQSEHPLSPTKRAVCNTAFMVGGDFFLLPLEAAVTKASLGQRIDFLRIFQESKRVLPLQLPKQTFYWGAVFGGIGHLKQYVDTLHLDPCATADRRKKNWYVLAGGALIGGAAEVVASPLDKFMINMLGSPSKDPATVVIRNVHREILQTAEFSLSKPPRDIALSAIRVASRYLKGFPGRAGLAAGGVTILCNVKDWVAVWNDRKKEEFEEKKKATRPSSPRSGDESTQSAPPLETTDVKPAVGLAWLISQWKDIRVTAAQKKPSLADAIRIPPYDSRYHRVDNHFRVPDDHEIYVSSPTPPLDIRAQGASSVPFPGYLTPPASPTRNGPGTQSPTAFSSRPSSPGKVMFSLTPPPVDRDCPVLSGVRHQLPGRLVSGSRAGENLFLETCVRNAVVVQERS